MSRRGLSTSPPRERLLSGRGPDPDLLPQQLPSWRPPAGPGPALGGGLPGGDASLPAADGRHAPSHLHGGGRAAGPRLEDTPGGCGGASRGPVQFFLSDPSGPGSAGWWVCPQRSLEDEISRTTAEDLPIFAISYLVIFLYISLALGSYTSWRRMLVRGARGGAGGAQEGINTFQPDVWLQGTPHRGSPGVVCSPSTHRGPSPALHRRLIPSPCRWTPRSRWAWAGWPWCWAL